MLNDSLFNFQYKRKKFSVLCVKKDEKINDKQN